MIHVSCSNPDYRYSLLSAAFRVDLEYQLTKKDRDLFVAWCQDTDPFLLQVVDRINSYRSKYHESDFEEIRITDQLRRSSGTFSSDLPIIKDTSTP